MENLGLRDFDALGLASVIDDRNRHGKVLHSVDVDVDGFRRRPDGSVVSGLTYSQWEAYREKYSNLSIQELAYIRDTMNKPHFCEIIFEGLASVADRRKASEKRYGKRASLATSLFMLLSVHVKPISERNPFSVHGEIKSGEKCSKVRDYIYKGVHENVGSEYDDGNLILNGPSRQCDPYDACFILQSRKLSIRLYDEQGQCLYPWVNLDVEDEDPISLDYSKHNFEHVGEKVVQNSDISLTLKYVDIPMGVFGRLELRIFNKKFSVKKDKYKPQKMLKVYGKVVATYRNTFGNYKSEEMLLFYKNRELGQYEMLDLDEGNNLLISGRTWVAAPVYSFLCLHIQLFDFDKRESILEQHLELGTDDPYGSSHRLVAGEFLISASALWFTPSAAPAEFVEFGKHPMLRDFELPPQHSAIEVFSVLICHKEECAIHGRLQFTCGMVEDFKEIGIDIFRREEKKEGALSLFGKSSTIPVLDGSRLYEDFSSFSMICDLKDIEGPSSIKGYACYSEQRHPTYPTFYRDRQLCSIFQGDHGFAALHYSVFSSATHLDLKVFYKQKESQGVESLTFSGSIYAQYTDCDYSSQYKKDCYRICLFKRSSENSAKMDREGSIPLSRSSFVVPSFSAIGFDVDLMIGTQKVSKEIIVPIGKITESIPKDECEVEFVLKWNEVK